MNELTGTMKFDDAGRAVIVTDKPKPPDAAILQSEIDSIKRTLYNAIDKLEKIQRREAELTTT
jgi:hypothetical protein